jgi:hypothetical protein
MAMKIRFFSDAYLAQPAGSAGPGRDGQSKRASHRLRGDVTCQALLEQGHDAKILTNWSEVDSDTIVIFLKHSSVDSIQRARDLGARTVYDLCDNKFGEKKEYAPCCLTADLVSVNSVQMGVSVKTHTGRDSIVMPDPFERPKLLPKFSPGTDINLLWFGSQSSFKFLPMAEIWQRLEKEVGNYSYTMVSANTDRLLSKFQLRQRKGEVTGINLDRVIMKEWTWELQGQLLEQCDIVLMPVRTHNPRTDTKSANRVIDSLMSGRFVITTSLASYEEFAPYTWQGDYIEGIKWAQANPDQVLDKITKGQQYVELNYSAAVLSNKFIEDILYAIKG